MCAWPHAVALLRVHQRPHRPVHRDRIAQRPDGAEMIPPPHRCGRRRACPCRRRRAPADRTGRARWSARPGSGRPVSASIVTGYLAGADDLRGGRVGDDLRTQRQFRPALAKEGAEQAASGCRVRETFCRAARLTTALDTEHVQQQDELLPYRVRRPDRRRRGTGCLCSHSGGSGSLHGRRRAGGDPRHRRSPSGVDFPSLPSAPARHR